ncbi:class I SAM-dependent methyltransferase, partial [Corynebacterium bovis]
ALAAAVTARSRATELDDAERRDFRRIHDLVTDAALDAMTAQIAQVTSASPDGTATRDAIVAGTGAQGHGTLMDRWIDELDRAGRVRCADGLVSVTDTAAGAATDTGTAAARWEEIHRLDDRLGYGRRQLDYLRSSLDELPGLLEGSVDPLSLLFPGGDMAVARASYGENRLASYLNGVCAAAVGHHARSLAAAGRTCRVLEIGAGVGGTTADVLAELADLTDPTDRPGPGVDYLFTDVSRYFTDAAAREWPQVRTGLFDINTDPAEQGVEPGSVDVVLCANVLHNARDIDVALRRVAGMLAPGGVLVVIDSTATNAPLMASMEFKEGLGDATDARLGTGSPFLTFAQWREAVAASPLESVAVLPEAGSVLELGAQHVFIVRKPEVRAGSGEGLDAARVRTAAADVLPASMRPRRIGV